MDMEEKVWKARVGCSQGERDLYYFGCESEADVRWKFDNWERHRSELLRVEDFYEFISATEVIDTSEIPDDFEYGFLRWYPEPVIGIPNDWNL